ncbi:MAG TPA: hypothetical protein VKB42_20780, partial [Dongiaceae bacterium]|nr:hypothetical protein [Dongiaceae bacterium]
MQKRVVFRNRWLGVALVVPQLLLIFTFFYWPAGEALYWAFTLPPEAGFLAFLNKLSPGLWNPTLNGFDAMVAIIIAFAW